MTYINKDLQDKFGFSDESDEGLEEKPHSRTELLKIVPSLKPNNIPSVIKRFVVAVETNQINSADINELRKDLTGFAQDHDNLSNRTIARLYEYQALLMDVQGETQEARGSAEQSSQLLGRTDDFISEEGKELISYDVPATTSEGVPTARSAQNPSVPKKPFYKRKVLYLIIVILLVIVWQPIADVYVVVSASPAQKALAEKVGLTNRGKAIFLAAKPEVLDATGFGGVCQQSGSTNLEEGCYLPQLNKIYVRVMPDELKSEETVKAAHEMLHAVYQRYDSSTKSNIDAMVEKQYQVSSNPELDGVLAQYAKSEPGARDDELFAILGTEYPNLNTDLENEYSKYLTFRQNEVNAASQTKDTFNNYVSQLDNLQGIIKNEQSLADKYYASSVSWARAGNAYQDDYYYNLYSNEYNNAGRDIDSYNQIVDKYNLLIDQYSGKAYTPINVDQKSGQ